MKPKIYLIFYLKVTSHKYYLISYYYDTYLLFIVTIIYFYDVIQLIYFVGYQNKPIEMQHQGVPDKQV